MTFLYPNVQNTTRVIFFSLMLMLAPALGAGQNATDSSGGTIQLFSSKDGVSQDGHLKLEWSPAKTARGLQFEVQQADNPAFDETKVIYQGPDRATFVSGLENGTYFFRVRVKGQEWSDVLEMKVVHHSLSLTYILLGLGGMVFLCTAGMVLHGVRKTAQIQ